MATNWAFELGVSNVGSGTAAAQATGTVTPNVGDLMVVSANNHSGTTAQTSVAISDSSVGGAAWNLIGSVTPEGPAFGQGAWWKKANANDHNGGSGITVTATFSGGTGTQATKIECDIFRVPAGFVIVGIDLAGTGVSSGSAASLSFSPSIGSTYANYTDELAWIAAGTGGVSNGGGLSGSFVGTSSGSLAVAIATNDNFLANFFGGNAQSSPVAASNIWSAGWATARNNDICMGATFVYKSVNAGIPPALLVNQ